MDAVVLLERKPFFSWWTISSIASLCIGSTWFWFYDNGWADSSAGLWIALFGAVGTLYALFKSTVFFTFPKRVELSDGDRCIRITHKGREYSADVTEVGQSELFVVTLLFVPVVYSFSITMHHPSTVVRTGIDGGGSAVAWPWRKPARSFPVHSWFVHGGRRRLLAAAAALLGAQRAMRESKTDVAASTPVENTRMRQS